MTDFLDALEARLPTEVDRRARTLAPNDRRRLRGAIDRALAPAPRMKRTRLWVGLAAAAVLIAASAAAGIAHRTPSNPTRSAPARVSPEPIVTPKSGSTVAFEPAVSVDDLPRVAPQPVVATTADTAADLFARANRARQSGDAPNAVTLYEKLEKRFPASNEAAVAHVSLARILLDRDAQKALAELDLYLGSGATDLREEALALRARAFGTLGRGADEKRAWQTLLAEHPDSLYGGRAKERIAALP